MSDRKILVVDDNESTRNVLSRQLALLNHHPVPVDDGLKAIEMMATSDFHMVLLDINMPNMNGIDVLRSINGHRNETPVLMVSGLRSADVVKQALRDGAYDYIMKPWSIDELRAAVDRAMEHSRLSRENKRHQLHLENSVRERTAELETALTEINATYRETILALGSALETRDVETQHHALRVAHYSALIANAVGIDDAKKLQHIEWGAYLHDIGKIGVPDSILRKPDILTPSEWEIMRCHPEIGRRMIANIPFLKDVVSIVYCHHERYDGTGYPRRLKGELIPIEARVFAVADSLDAMISDRPYRASMSFTQAIDIITEESGRQFDPAMVKGISKIPKQRWFEEPRIFSH